MIFVATSIDSYIADIFPYIADDKPYITDDKPYIADDKPYIADKRLGQLNDFKDEIDGFGR